MIKRVREVMAEIFNDKRVQIYRMEIPASPLFSGGGDSSENKKRNKRKQRSPIIRHSHYLHFFQRKWEEMAIAMENVMSI